MFYIYENWQAGPHKAVLHTGDCGICRNGQGLAGGSDPNHGRWHGPLISLDDALSVQGRLNVKLMKTCRCVK